MNVECLVHSKWTPQIIDWCPNIFFTLHGHQVINFKGYADFVISCYKSILIMKKKGNSKLQFSISITNSYHQVKSCSSYWFPRSNLSFLSSFFAQIQSHTGIKNIQNNNKWGQKLLHGYTSLNLYGQLCTLLHQTISHAQNIYLFRKLFSSTLQEMFLEQIWCQKLSETFVKKNTRKEK